jgi:hypothetical protein
MRTTFRKLNWNGSYSLRPTFLGIALMIGLGIVFWVTTRTDTPRRELRRMRAELRAKGEALSRKELVCRPPRWDLIQPFTNAVSSLAKLQSDPNLNVMSYISNGVALALWRMEKPSWRGIQGTGWTGSQTWQDLAHVMEQAGPILEQVRKLPKEPLGDLGLADKTPIFKLIHLSFWFTEAAVVALQRGDCASALENLEAGVALAQVCREEPNSTSQIGRSVVISIMIRPTWEALQHPGWTEPELCRLQAAWESVTPLSVAELALEGELADGSDLDEESRHLPRTAPLKMHFSWPFYLMSDGSSDQLFGLRYRWDGLQLARALGRHEPWALLKPQAEIIQRGALNMLASPSRHWIPNISICKVVEIMRGSVRNETARQLILTEVAIQRFKLRNSGVPPTSLSELSPEFLKAPTRDPMTGKPLLYHPLPDGSYLLYSTGEDGVDDGGDPTPINSEPPELLNAKDMVWSTHGRPLSPSQTPSPSNQTR